MYRTLNPANGQTLATYPQHSNAELQQILEAAHQAHLQWRNTPFAQRALPMRAAAQLLRERTKEYGALITAEMGKIQREAEAEVKKCALIFDYYADQGALQLADEAVSAGFARSYYRYEPMGAILAVMPWNFPFWQALRFIAPNLMGGNACLLKHAPNVFGTALALERLLLEAGFPANLMRSLLIEPDQVALALESPLVKAVTLTGSERAGMAIASKAGRELKKAVMELGGSDPFLVLADAELDRSCQTSVLARCFNAGQVCISSKRFIVVEPLYEQFLERHQAIMEGLKVGDPTDPATDVGPMARADLMQELHQQVLQSIHDGARLVTGGAPLPGPGNFYPPTLLADVTPEMTCFRQELFGPVSSLIPARDEEHAIELANASPYGLGASVWSRDVARAEAVAQRLESGMVFINAMVVSHPALPFGGVKRSGFGRECGPFGIREFQNVKTVVVA